MPNAAMVGCMSTGHSVYPPRPAKTGSDTVFINGKPAHRKDDEWSPHCAPDCKSPDGCCHDGVTKKNCSSTVFINGKPAAFVGSAIACMGEIKEYIKTGSSNVYVGS